jgi:carbamoyl-phosphate synthase large subunit
MRILVTAIGSISAPFVIKTIKEMKMEVVGVDIYPQKWIAASKEVDFFHQVPHLSLPESYKGVIMELCRKYDVKMIIPLTDVEVDYFSVNVNDFEKQGIILGVSKKDIVQLLRNKLRVFEKFKDSKIKVIPTYTKATYMDQCNVFPCVAKKIDGRSSEGLFIIKEAGDFERNETRGGNYVFQPFINGNIVTVDILKSLEQKNIFIARKELMRTKNGAGIAVEIIEDKNLTGIIEYFCRVIDFSGCINIEFIKKEKKYFLMDINPRFSAGVVFSDMAGYNFVKNHIFCFLGKQIHPLREVKYGAIFTRKYIEVVV